MTKQQKKYLDGLYEFSVRVWTDVCQRIRWSIEMFMDKYPDVPYIEAQHYLVVSFYEKVPDNKLKSV